MQVDENGEWIDHESRDSWVILDARTTRHQVTTVHGTRISITYHTPQQLHRLKMDHWNQLREAGFPVDRVWEQGIQLDASGEEELTFSSSLMNVRQQSQASEVETQEDVLQTLQVDHNLLLRPTLQAMCWLADIILSLDGTLQLEVMSRPTFNIQAIDNTIQDMQLQLNELTEQRHQIELSVVAICLTRMMIALARLTVQLGLQFHMGVILTHCLTNGFWNRERDSLHFASQKLSTWFC